ncbi:hypothetical protein K437DRAFT_259411 [Tilletiaria anomala UBC 951]|uniref:Mitochondrial distribution and morphology protein 34 n=1 Tax=Tilletiaria anomala (strain ATCC 24038 / CBS 436.72 / UBC 951) TaxID=1037660 RepID=A0A066VAH8_TILAU|nr:uncharacterized protein K437DRAFT_259411 [Tilletiaria anomala UBC 951]KDN38461.1 hypothetical protein K437DRAFT_259411 [Tilletiaria anomala UBC 951]
MSFNFRWPEFSEGFHNDAKTMLDSALNKGAKPKVIADDIKVEELGMGTIAPELDILEIGDLSMDRFRGIFRLTYAGDAHLVLSTKVQANPLSAARGSPASTPAGDESVDKAGSMGGDSAAAATPDLEETPSSPFGYGRQDDSIWFGAASPSSNPLTASLFPAAANRRGGILFAATPLIVPMKLRLSHLRLRAIIVLIVSKAKGITLVFKNDPLESVNVSSTFDSVGVIAKYLQQEIEGQLREMFREDLPSIIHRLSQKWLLAGSMTSAAAGDAGGGLSPAAKADGASQKEKEQPPARSASDTALKLQEPLRKPLSRAQSASASAHPKGGKAASNAGPSQCRGPTGSMGRAQTAASTSGIEKGHRGKAASVSGTSVLSQARKRDMGGKSSSQASMSSILGSSSTLGGLSSSSSTARTTPSPGPAPGSQAVGKSPSSPFTSSYLASMLGDYDGSEQDLYDPTYGFKADDPLTPAPGAGGGPPGFSGLGSLVKSKKPGMGLKELVPLSPPSSQTATLTEGHAHCEAMGVMDGDAESVDPIESDFEGAEEDALNFYFPSVDRDNSEQDDEIDHLDRLREGRDEEEEDESSDDDNEEETDDSEAADESQRNARADYGDDVEDDPNPGDFSRFGYPPPTAAYSETGVGDDGLAAAFGSNSPRQDSAHRHHKRTSSKGARSTSSRGPSRSLAAADGRSNRSTPLQSPEVEYETVPAVGGGVITRPRTFHFVSYAQAPELSPDEMDGSFCADSLNRMGDDTVRGLGSGRASSTHAASSTFGGKSSRTATIMGLDSPRQGYGRRRAPTECASSPKRDRWTNWVKEESDDEEDQGSQIEGHTLRDSRRCASHASELSADEKRSLDSLPPEPVDTSSYEFRTREYRQRYGVAVEPHWQRSKAASRPELTQRHSNTKPTPSGLLQPLPLRDTNSVLPSTSMTLDASAHFTDLVYSHQTLSPFTRPVEHCTVRSAPLTPGFEPTMSGHASSRTIAAAAGLLTPTGAADALTGAHYAVAPSQLHSRLRAAMADSSTPPPGAAGLKHLSALPKAYGERWSAHSQAVPIEAKQEQQPKGRRRRTFKLGRGSGDTTHQNNGDDERAAASTSSRLTKRADSLPVSAPASHTNSSRSSSQSPKESLLGSARYRRGTTVGYSTHGHASSHHHHFASNATTRVSAGRWDAIRE